MFFKESRMGLNHQTNKRLMHEQMISGVVLGTIFSSSRSTKGQTLCAGRRAIPFTTQVHLRVRRTVTTLDVLPESRINDYCNVESGPELS